MSVKSSITHTNLGDSSNTITVRVWFEVSPGNDPPSVHVTIDWDPEELELTTPAHYSPDPPTFISALSGTVLWANHQLTGNSSTTADPFEIKLQCANEGPYDSVVTAVVEVVNDRSASRRHSVIVSC